MIDPHVGKSTLRLETISLADLGSEIESVAKSVQSKIHAAFGLDGLGILLVNQLPESYAVHREALLQAGHCLPSLPPAELSALEFPSLHYAVGYSHGREQFDGKPDLAKASFYANAQHEDPANGDTRLARLYPSHMHRNQWPSNPVVRELQPAFMHIGALITEVGLLVARQCDTLVRQLRGDQEALPSLVDMLAKSRSAKGRVLHYFASATQSVSMPWCGYHNDHGTITGLIASQLFTKAGKPVTAAGVGGASDGTRKRAGLHVLMAGMDEMHARKVEIPADCLAMQIGETAQIATAGLLRATAHTVLVEPGCAHSRVSMAVFLQPNPWEVLTLPAHTDAKDVLASSALVPSLLERFESGDTFGKFAHNTFAKYY